MRFRAGLTGCEAANQLAMPTLVRIQPLPQVPISGELPGNLGAPRSRCGMQGGAQGRMRTTEEAARKARTFWARHDGDPRRLREMRGPGDSRAVWLDVGSGGGPLDDGPSDVHARYERSVARIATTSVDGISGLLSTLDSEWDPAMAESALLSLVDHLASSSSRRIHRGAKRVRDSQASAINQPTRRRLARSPELPGRRDARRIRNRSDADWLQLRLAAELSPSQGLAVLVQHGRTRRIRTLATHRVSQT